MDEAEKLRQLVFNMMARAAANEAITRSLFAMWSMTDDSPGARARLVDGLFAHISRTEGNRDWEGSEEFNAWMKQRTETALQVEFKLILEEIDAARNARRPKSH
jgi:uncharacterized membrane-anchored protein